ncbi:MAG: hypothetical protein ABSB83_03300 [Methanomassiliicoccales archaeon]|jgi:heme/copper-type cytochrome/quinol oxidase subunit 2
MPIYILVVRGMILEGSTSEAPKPKKGNSKNIVAVVVIVLVVFAVFALALWEYRGITIVSWGVERNVQIVGNASVGYTSVGICVFTVNVKNSGDAVGLKTIWCEFTIEQNTYHASLSITLVPAETQTYTITVYVPGYDVSNSGSGLCYLA